MEPWSRLTISIWFSIQEHSCYKLREKLIAWNLECIVETTWETEAAYFTFYVVELLFSCSVVSYSATPWTAVHQALLSFISWSLLKLMSIELVMPSNLLISVIPFSCLQSCPASRSFPVSQLFASGGQSIGASALAAILPVNIQDWFPSGLTGLIFFQFKGLSRVFSNTTVQKHQFFGPQLSLWSNSHIHTWLPEKP